MNQYTIDYSVPPSRRWLRNRDPNRRMKRAFRQLYLLIGGLVIAIATFGLLRMRSEVQLHRKRYQTQAIQYDSLLAAKLKVDQQLEQIQSQLNKH